MGIAKHKPDARPPVAPALPRVEPENYKSVVVDDNATPLNSLVAYMGGSPWTVDYYSQVVSKHNDLKDLDPGQNGIYQQYTKIVQLEIRVTTPLAGNQDTDSTLMTVTGAALIYPFMTPNTGDTFVAAAGNGHQGIYRITNTDRKTFNRESAYAVDYELVAYVDVDTARFNDLESKVIRTYYFSKDRLLEGLSPNLNSEDHERMVNLSDMFGVLCEFYFKTFFNREFSTLIVPGQNTSIYDSFLLNYLLKIVDTSDAPEIRQIKNLTTEYDAFMQQRQFWQVLLDRDYAGLNYCNRDMGLAYIKAFGTDPMMVGIRYSRIEYIVYPIQADHSVHSGEHKPQIKAQALDSIMPTESQPGSLSDLIFNKFIDQNTTTPFIKPVLGDPNYVLSEAFYNGTDGQSVLEALVTDYLKGNAINVERLQKLVQGYPRWARLEQFYYIPILLTLLKAATKGLY